MIDPIVSGPIPHRRFRRFLLAVGSGYAQLIANIAYVLLSVPLALHYLPKREFGLWAVATQLGGYLQLIDFGMSSSFARHLIDYKDQRSAGGYGSIIKTGALVLTLQGVIALIGGAAIAFFTPALLHVDLDLRFVFRVVLFVQCAVIALDFPARLPGQLLVAHQRADVTNYSQIAFFFASYATLWFSLKHGSGIFSLVWANLAGWLAINIGNTAVCLYLRLFPKRQDWGKVSWPMFREVFGFGKDLFWIALGAQMINASQTIIVTRALGLDAAAVWSVCIRPFTLANQLIWRPFDFAYPMLAEMVARGEEQRFRHRFRGLVTLTASLSVLGAVAFALCNQPFIAVWTKGNIHWPLQNDLLLSVWMIILAMVHCHCTVPAITKRIGFMRYIYFAEGFAFLVVGFFGATAFGFTGLIATSILCSLLLSFSYGIGRSMRQFHLGLRDILIDWMSPSLRLLVWVAIVGAALYPLARHFDSSAQLLLYVPVIAVAGGYLLFRVGLGQGLRAELIERINPRLARLLTKIFPSSNPARKI